MGLGCVLSGSPRVSEDMLCAAAEALPRMLSPDQLARGEIFPRIADIRKVSACVAAAVVRAAAAESGCRNAEALDLLAQGTSDGGLAAWAFGKMYSPAYVPLVCSNAHRS